MGTCLASPLFPPQSKEATQRIQQQQESKHQREGYSQICLKPSFTLFTKITLETLVQCITMKVKEEVIWKFYKIKTDGDRPKRSLNCLY